MARPRRCRRVCAEPAYRRFEPRPDAGAGDVVLTVDEYEAIRLVDYEKQTHEQCARQMDISRTTVTEIYESARGKLADCLVNGKVLVIEGGPYKVCPRLAGQGCGRPCRQGLPAASPSYLAEKGAFVMRIAVPYENGNVFQHFGHSEQFRVYDVENGQIVSRLTVLAEGGGHGALAGFLSGLKIDVLLCGGIGAGARDALAQAGIKLCAGVTGAADDAVSAYLSGGLHDNPAAGCGHHHHEHGHHCHGHDGCNEDKHGCAGNHCQSK